MNKKQSKNSKLKAQQKAERKKESRAFFKQMFFIIFAEIIGIAGTIAAILATSRM